MAAASQATPQEEGTVLVEFIGTGSRTIPMPGGITYRFGSDREHRVRSVRRAHLSRFMNSKEFRPYAPVVVAEPEPELVPSN